MLLVFAALGLAVQPIGAVGGQTDDIDRPHDTGRDSSLEPDEQVERRPNAYLMVESLNGRFRYPLNKTPLAGLDEPNSGVTAHNKSIFEGLDLHDWASIFEEAEDECDRFGLIPNYFCFGSLPWVRLEAHGRFLCE